MNIELLDEPTTELTVPARAQLALNSSKTRADLTELVKKSVNIQEIKNPAGRAECHAAAMVLVKARTTIAAVGKTARDDATKFSKAVISEEQSLTAITEAEEKRLLALRDAWDAKIALAKAAEEQAEREQAAKIQARIDALGLDMSLVSAVPDCIMVELARISEIEVSLEIFGARAGEAEQTKMTTQGQLTKLFNAAVTQELQRAALFQQQETLAAAQKKLDDDQAAAAEAYAADILRLDSLLAEQDRWMAVVRDQLDADLASLRQAEQAKIEADARLVRETAASEQKILDDAAAVERQRLDDEAAQRRAVLAAQEVAARVKAEAELKARIEAEDAASAKDQRVRNAAHDMLHLLQRLLECSRHGDLPPDELIESIERIIEQATGESA